MYMNFMVITNKIILTLLRSK